MWRERSHNAVFVPRVPDGSRVAFSQKLLKSTARVRANARIDLEPMTCERHGSGLRLTGGLSLSGPRARLMFRKGNDTEPEHGGEPLSSDSSLLPEIPFVEIPERRFHLVAGARPFVWIGFRDALENSLSAPICLGRIDQTRLRGERPFELSAVMNVWLALRGLDRWRGPILDMTGDLAFPQGVWLVMRLASSCDRAGGPGEHHEIAEIPVLPPGATLPVPQREVAPGSVENPWVSFLLRDAEGAVPGEEMMVGRCVRLH